MMPVQLLPPQIKPSAPLPPPPPPPSSSLKVKKLIIYLHA